MLVQFWTGHDCLPAWCWMQDMRITIPIALGTQCLRMERTSLLDIDINGVSRNGLTATTVQCLYVLKHFQTWMQLSN
jgi:hypothetical protein